MCPSDLCGYDGRLIYQGQALWFVQTPSYFWKQDMHENAFAVSYFDLRLDLFTVHLIALPSTYVEADRRSR